MLIWSKSTSFPNLVPHEPCHQLKNDYIFSADHPF